MTQHLTTRHLVSINDLTNSEIESVFEIAQGYLDELGDRHVRHRIARGKSLAQDHILATLFFEPSTRTRLSFESAMSRLGGAIITSADPATSSAAKGESLAELGARRQQLCRYCGDPPPARRGCRLASEYATVPVINGGDGSHEHPTQTLCDLFTLRQKHKTIKNLKVAISGDLKGSRTIHSFVYALARFGAMIEPLPAPGDGAPAHVDRGLRDEFRSEIVDGASRRRTDCARRALRASNERTSSRCSPARKSIGRQHHREEDRCGRTSPAFRKRGGANRILLSKNRCRFSSQREILGSECHASTAARRRTRCVHRLGQPRRLFPAGRLRRPGADGADYASARPRSGKSLQCYPLGFHPTGCPPTTQPRSLGIRCCNSNCIVHEASEAQYVRNRFHVIRWGPSRDCMLRCSYCEADIECFVAANKRQMWYSPDRNLLANFEQHSLRDLLAFASEQEAREAGYHPKRTRPPANGLASAAWCLIRSS